MKTYSSFADWRFWSLVAILSWIVSNVVGLLLFGQLGVGTLIGSTTNFVLTILAFVFRRQIWSGWQFLRRSRLNTQKGLDKFMQAVFDS